MLRPRRKDRGKVFEHDPIPYQQLNSEDTPNGRFYVLPNGQRVRSMTTMLGMTSDHTWLDEWRARLGAEAADAEAARCADRGEGVHLACEHYVNNKPMEECFKAAGEYPAMFLQIKSVLDKRCGLVLGQEIPLYSYKMEIAGRVDLIAWWYHEGKWHLAIIDYKTSNYIKNKGGIEAYQCQLCGYATCLYEMTGLRATLLVNVISNETGFDPTVIPFTVQESFPKLAKRISLYRELLYKTGN